MLKDGKVAESGTHPELLGMDGGVYAELWNGMSYEDYLTFAISHASPPTGYLPPSEVELLLMILL